jgi:uncharacterized phage protein gp47/JayE
MPSFQRPTLAQLFQRIQQDFVSRLQLAGGVLRRSVVGVMSRVWAGATHELYGYLDFLSRQVFPDTSELEFLERQGALYGITRKAATFATGNVTFSGSNGTLIPTGTLLQRSDGVRYETQADATIAAGTATATVDALTAGETGNANAGVSLSLVSPIIGVSSSAIVAAGALTLGSNTESDDDLRTRVIERLQFAPQGGAANDYVAWAKQVAGVTRAWVFPAELGLGTVTVRFVRDDDVSIIPDAAEVTAVQDYLAARRPVTAQVTVVAPTAVALNFTLHIAPDTTATRAAVEAELRDLLARDQIVPGGTLLLSQIRTSIGIADGITDFSLTVPAANVTHTTGQMPVFGAITWV